MESVTRNIRSYGHFCVLARALERVGDRWSLLVIRDLVTGPRRFTDLMDRLGGITPATLSQRLRELEDAGVLAADREPGRREVWYHLTPAGDELSPVIDALGSWGLRHAWRWPRDGEPLHAEHLLSAVIRAVDDSGDHEPGRWLFRLDGSDYLAQGDGSRWSLTTTATAPADVTITATTQALAAFIFSGSGSGSGSGVEIAGEPEAVRRFRRLAATLATAVPAAQADG